MMRAAVSYPALRGCAVPWRPVARQLTALSDRLPGIAPARAVKVRMHQVIDGVAATLNDFPGGQSLAMTDCRLVAEGKA